MDPNPRSPSSSSCCCCFFSSVSWERVAVSDDGTRPESASSSSLHRRWWKESVGALKKAREWSEIAAGPRWKNFIRRFNRSSKYRRNGSGRRFGFGYDPLSYSLNFDGGNDGASDDVDIGRMSFSTRFVVPPASGKSSMDLGGGDTPALFTAPPIVAAAVH